MRDWSLRKKEKRIKRRKKNDQISTWSIFDFLTNVADIIIWPIRFAFWILRGIGRVIGNLLDGI